MQTFCELPFQKLKVDAEGDVTMCCFQERKCLGNIIEEGLEAIWNSELANEIRATTLQNKLHPKCSITATCPYLCQNDLTPQNLPQIDHPTTLEIDLPTQHCNIGGEHPTKEHPACLMCERTWRYAHQNDRLDEVCDMLKPCMSQFIWLHIQGVSEPFWKDKIFDLMDRLAIWSHKDKIKVTTTTNGTILTEERLDKWYALPKNIITFSIDAATSSTYKTIRVLDAYDRVIDALMECTRRRKPNQLVQIHNNINLLNVNEVVGMVEVAAKAKVDLLDFNATYLTPEICVNESNLHTFHKAETQIIETSKRLGVKIKFTRRLTLNYLDDPKFIKI